MLFEPVWSIKVLHVLRRYHEVVRSHWPAVAQPNCRNQAQVNRYPTPEAVAASMAATAFGVEGGLAQKLSTSAASATRALWFLIPLG